MTLPGLALFYGGLVRDKNILSSSSVGNLPEAVYFMFQLTFAVITPTLVIGFVAGVVCFQATQLLKRVLQVDDSLDVSPVHGVGGVVGSLLTAVFASVSLGGAGFTVQKSIVAQLGVQALGVAAAAAWCALMTWLILKALDATPGLRVSDEYESGGARSGRTRRTRLHQPLTAGPARYNSRGWSSTSSSRTGPRSRAGLQTQAQWRAVVRRSATPAPEFVPEAAGVPPGAATAALAARPGAAGRRRRGATPRSRVRSSSCPDSAICR